MSDPLDEYGRLQGDVQMESLQFVAIRRGRDFAVVLAFAMASAAMCWIGTKYPEKFEDAMRRLRMYAPAKIEGE